MLSHSHMKSIHLILVLMFTLFGVTPTAQAQLVIGDVVAVATDATMISSSAVGQAALIRIDAAGVRTVLSDLKSAAQGKVLNSPWGGVFVESMTSVLVGDSTGLYRVSLPGGNRTVVSDFGNFGLGAYFPNAAGYTMAMANPETIYFSGIGPQDGTLGVYKLDIATGQRSPVSSFGNLNQGDFLSVPGAITVDRSGNIVVMAYRTTGAMGMYRINPANGERTFLSNVTNTTVLALNSFIYTALGSEPSGNILALDNVGLALIGGNIGTAAGLIWRVNGTTGATTLLTAFNDATQGALGLNPQAMAVDALGGIVVADSAQTIPAVRRSKVFRVSPSNGARTLLSDLNDPASGPISGGGIFMIATVGPGLPAGPPTPVGPPLLTVPAGGSSTVTTTGMAATVRVGYATGVLNSGQAPFGTAVFRLSQNEYVVSDAGVPASPPTQNARIFIDYRTGVASGSGTVDINTGVAIANRGSALGVLTYVLRDRNGTAVAAGTGSISAGSHFARFLHELNTVAAGFNLPANFSTVTRFGSLEILSSQPISVVALRLTTNQRQETLLTSTPIADLATPTTASPVFFPHLANGGGYTTTFVLLNTSTAAQAGTLAFLDDAGVALSVRETGGATGSSLPYSIPAGGTFVLQTDGSGTLKTGWARLTPTTGTAPVGAGVFSFTPAGILVTESGVPAAAATTGARIYVDTSSGYDTGIAMANVNSTATTVNVRAFQKDGTTPVGGVGSITLAPGGHDARFAGQLVSGLPAGFTGVIEVSANTPFAALTLRSLYNGRGDFLLTTFPVADATRAAPAPMVFPQIADGGGYSTQVILLSASGGASVTVNFIADDATVLNLPTVGP